MCLCLLMLAGLGYRHVQIVLLFSGLFMAYALRVNISVGIVAMVDKSSDERIVSYLFANTNRCISTANSLQNK